MIHKYEFVKETKWDGEKMFYTKKNGLFQSGTLSYDEAKARGLFEKFVAQDGPQPTEEVMESVTKEF